MLMILISNAEYQEHESHRRVLKIFVSVPGTQPETGHFKIKAVYLDKALQVRYIALSI